MNLNDKATIILLSHKDKEYLSNIIKIFNNSNSEVLLISSDLDTSHNEKYFHIYNPQIFTSHGINIGIKFNTNSFVIVCGSRSIPSQNYTSEAIKILNEHNEIGCVGGQIIHAANTDTGKAIALAMGAPLGMGLLSFRSLKKSGFTDTVSVPVFKKEVIDKVGLFDESLIRNQDDDYSYRIKKAGYKIWHEASINSTYYVREKFNQLAGQFFQYGFWKNYVNKKHKTITTSRQLVPPAFLLTLLVLLLINVQFFLLTVALYIIIFFTHAIKLNQFKLIPAIKTTFAFIVMHISYGAGYWYGILYAFILNKPAPETVKKITR